MDLELYFPVFIIPTITSKVSTLLTMILGWKIPVGYLMLKSTEIQIGDWLYVIQSISTGKVQVLTNNNQVNVLIETPNCKFVVINQLDTRCIFGKKLSL